MSEIIKDRVYETTTTTGTGAYTLAGVKNATYVSFASVCTNGDTMQYCVTDVTNGGFEIGIGTYNSGTLARTTILVSSNANAAVSWAAGTKEIFHTVTASKVNTFGTVSSVAMTVPTGLTVSGSAITTSGTLALTLTAGYSIPTTTSQSNWDTAYTDRNKWDGGSTGLTAATGRTSLGGTTVGQNLFTLTNPGALLSLGSM